MWILYYFSVDNNTWNNSHIALVGKAMSSNESAAYHIMTALDVDYVLGNSNYELLFRVGPDLFFSCRMPDIP